MGTRYSYKKEQDAYVLYDGDTVVRNPHDKIISTDKEELAAKLVEALERGEDFNSPESLLCFHYSYHNLCHHTLDEFVEEFTSYMDYDTFLWDKYLMFMQDSPVRQAVAPYLAGMYSQKIRNFNKYQFLAILIIHVSFNSWVLSLRIIEDILEQVSETKTYTELKEEFLGELEAYDRIEFSDHADYDEKFDDMKYANYLKVLSKSIDNFAYYFNIK